ncbi:TetR/AcrR family transcriptional regulator [Vibrio palustris]|uniref:HTH-type transcriptional repressor ComR n=1 Tax=Vibrio palustris TaxID=1918946 RepID=A0A1R4B6B0_9VIBR|nr:TetR/AcrR family transcriptional regulator [Vibrio palustris]SJL84426.1 HTH-type transcriptional repressor ComR [Vibrio palustris]
MRAAEFDREKVLRAAMNQFIRYGFSKTSMQDLKRVTGLHPGSIYCAFENKRGLLLAALEQYADDRACEFEAFFLQADTVLAGITAYLQHIVSECQAESIRDCLLQKALSEFSQNDEMVEQALCEALAAWQQGLNEKLHIAQQKQELPADADCDFLCHYLTMGICGLRSFAHTKPQPAVIQQLADKLLAALYP